MRFEDYDIIHSVHDRVEKFRERTGRLPVVLMLSPEAYQWLRALQEEELSARPAFPLIGDWYFTIGELRLRVEIDEMADNFTIRVR